MKAEPAVGENIIIKDKYYTCKINDGKGHHCNLCGIKLFSDECMQLECTRYGRSDKTSVYFERIDPVPMSEVKAVFN